MYTVEQEILLARHQNDQLEMYITLRMSQYFKDQLSSEEPNNPGPTFFLFILLYSVVQHMLIDEQLLAGVQAPELTKHTYKFNCVYSNLTPNADFTNVLFNSTFAQLKNNPKTQL